MKKLLFSMLAVATMSVPSQAAEGLIDVKSMFGVKETGDNLERILKEKGMTVFNRVKHAESAEKIGIKLRDTELLIFGNPKIGAALMQCQLSVAIDLPLKALIWKDSEDQTWISYNDVQYLQKRHDIQNCDKVIAKMTKALDDMTHAAGVEPSK